MQQSSVQPYEILTGFMCDSTTLFQRNQSVTHCGLMYLAVCKHCGNVAVPASRVLFPVGMLCTTSLHTLCVFLNKGGCLIV